MTRAHKAQSSFRRDDVFFTMTIQLQATAEIWLTARFCIVLFRESQQERKGRCGDHCQDWDGLDMYSRGKVNIWLEGRWGWTWQPGGRAKRRSMDEELVVGSWCSRRGCWWLAVAISPKEKKASHFVMIRVNLLLTAHSWDISYSPSSRTHTPLWCQAAAATWMWCIHLMIQLFRGRTSAPQWKSAPLSHKDRQLDCFSTK